jgi:hypothetical protein
VNTSLSSEREKEDDGMFAIRGTYTMNADMGNIPGEGERSPQHLVAPLSPDETRRIQLGWNYFCVLGTEGFGLETGNSGWEHAFFLGNRMSWTENAGF